MRSQQSRSFREQGHRGQVLLEIETHLEQTGIDAVGDGGEQQRMPVARRTRHGFGGNAAASPGTVLHHDLLPDGL